MKRNRKTKGERNRVQQGTRKAQKLGSKYPFKASLIAILSIIPWLLWLAFFPAYDDFIACIKGANPSHATLSGDSEIKLQAFLWACVMIGFVLCKSYLLRTHLYNLRQRIATVHECLMHSVFIRSFKRYPYNMGHLSLHWRHNLTPKETLRKRFVLLHLSMLPAMVLLFCYLLVGVGGWILAIRYLAPLPIFVLHHTGSSMLEHFDQRGLWDYIAEENTFAAIFKQISMADFAPLVAMFWFVFQFLIGSSLVLNGSLFLFRWCHGLSEHNLLRRLFFIGRGASSRWAGPTTYGKLPCRWGERNIFLGTTDFLDVGPEWGRSVYLRDDGHLLTIGCPGSGKSVSAIWPNLVLYKGSVIILDPKGEHARETYWYRNTQRQSWESDTSTRNNRHYDGDPSHIVKRLKGKSLCFKLDPFNEEPSIPNSYYNPLDEIDIDDDNVQELLSTISDGCVLPEGDKNSFWTDQAKTVIEGFIAYVLSCCDKSCHNLPYVHDLFIEHDPEIGLADPNRLDEVLLEMRCSEHGICSLAANILGDREGETFNGIMGTVRRSIKWMGDKAMRKHLTGGSDFTFPVFREDIPYTLYIVAPIGAKMKEQVRWLRVLTNMGITVMRNHKPKNRETLFILDEFPRLGGSLSAISEGLTTLRSQKIKLWPFIQNIGQLRKDYGEQGFTDFVEASSIQIFGVEGVDEKSTAEWVSKQLGQYYRDQDYEGKDARDILTPQEVVEFLGKSKPNQIVFHQDVGFPLRLKRSAHVRIRGRGGVFKRHPKMMGCFELKD